MRSIVHNKGGTPTRWLAVVVCLLALTACDTSQPAVPTATQAAPTENPCNVCQSVPPTRAPRTATPLQPTASETPATEGTPTAGGQTSGVAAVDTAQVQAPPTIDDNLPTPTAVTATATGAEITAVQALTSLKAKALEWQADVRLAMLANVRPGQQANMLGSALGDPNVFEATPGGKGRDWTLIAVSPTRGALAVGMDGTQVDLVREGSVTGEAIGGFSLPKISVLSLSSLDLSKLMDSDKLWQKMSKPTAASSAVALVVPEGFGQGALPTPAQGGPSPLLAYQLFSTDPSQPRQTLTLYDAFTGAVVLGNSGP